MPFFGRQNNKVYGVGLYLLAVWVLYGRKEVLPRSVIKAMDTKDGLKTAKRDPKQAIDFKAALASLAGGKTMFEIGGELKKAQKSN